MNPKTSYNIPLVQRKSFSPRPLPVHLTQQFLRTTNYAFHPDNGNSTFKAAKDFAELSPRISMKLNPGYRLEHYISPTVLTPPTVEFTVTDKLYNRKRDEQSKFNEHYCRTRVIYSKKH